jgi:hypothetical protein
METDKQHAYQLLDELAPNQIAAIVRLLQVMVHPAPEDDEPVSAEDNRRVAASREWFQKNPEGISLQQVVADSGLSLEQVQSSDSDKP